MHEVSQPLLAPFMPFLTLFQVLPKFPPALAEEVTFGATFAVVPAPPCCAGVKSPGKFSRPYGGIPYSPLDRFALVYTPVFHPV